MALRNKKFMSLQQAFTLLEQEVAQGEYALPTVAHLTSNEERLRECKLSIPCPLSKKDVIALVNRQTDQFKYKSTCYQIPCKYIQEKHKNQVCLLQNLDKNKKYIYR